MDLSNRLVPCCSIIAATLLLSACASQKEAEAPQVAPPPVQRAEEAPDEKWDTTDDSEKPEAKKEQPELKSSGRPTLRLKHRSVLEASVDGMGAVLTLGENASVVIPEGALADPVPYHFAQRKGITGPKRIGKNYEFAPALESGADPLILELPLPSWAKKANFAILKTRIRDGEQGEGIWKVVAATRIDHEKGIAILETSSLPEGWIYLTSQKPD